MQNMLKAERILIEQAGTVPVYFQAAAGVQKPYFKDYVTTPSAAPTSSTRDREKVARGSRRGSRRGPAEEAAC